jgi:hypothetical protein
VLIELANHNDDIQRLLEKGYALGVDGTHLVVRDIPYLDQHLALQVGAIVAKLEFIDKVRVKQVDHQVYFAGSAPYGLDGQLIPNLGGGPSSITLSKPDFVVQRSFSNKPADGFANFFDKIEHYVRVIAAPAMEMYGGNPLTFGIDTGASTGSVFKFHDTLSSRAEISDLAAVFKDEVVAIIGLGGTGSYVLDFLTKMPVKEIWGFDGDAYHVHNAFRSPGRLDESDFGKSKVEIYRLRYENFREGLVLHRKYVDRSSVDDFNGVTFAFVCVDKGSARAEIFDLLISLRIPFIDVGMGLNRKQGALAPGLSTRPFKTLLAKLSPRSPRLLLHRRRRLLLDRALQLQRARRQLVGLGLEQERIEAAAVVDALDRVGRDAQAHVAAERVGDEGDVAQVRQEPALGLDVGVAHLVAHLGALGRQFAAPRHLAKSSSIPASRSRGQARAGVQNHVHFQEPRTYRGRAAGRQGFRFAGRLGSRKRPGGF